LRKQNYYYFVATLPWLNYEDSPPVSSDDFREHCSTILDDENAGLLQYCYYNPSMAVETVHATGSDFIDHFLSRERCLALNLAYLRSGKLKRSSPGDPPHDVPRAEAVAKAAFEMDDPLEAAIYIDMERWGALDAMVGLDLFGVNNIFAHLMKLQLQERRQRYDAESGAAEYKMRYESILNEYNNSKV
jgi:hypothetical protein